MDRSAQCPQCGAALPHGVLEGHCPRCLIILAGSGTDGSEDGLPEPLRDFGPYQLLNEVARGGMGVVYRARQLALNRVVALKTILAGEFATPESVRRFRNEAQAAARLRHPNIVTIHDVGEHEGRQYLAMEFVDGPSFADLVRDRPMPHRRAAGYVRAVAQAVAYAHEQHVLHRDLKPSNILLDPMDHPRITDFGLARQLDSASSLTRGDEAMGSPGYMSPEQAIGPPSSVGPASDIYSLGAVLYHLLSGRPPFQGDTAHAVILQVQTAEPLTLRRLVPGVPRDLDTICLKCLEKDPSRRYLSAADLADDLERFLRQTPIRARPTSPVTLVWRRCRRRPVVAGLVVALLLTLGAGLWQTRRAEIAHVTSETTRTQSRINAYATDVEAAWAATERGLFADARRLLAKHLPASDRSDERGFEWRFIWHASEGQQLATLHGHQTTVCGVACSPDVRWAASTGMDGHICLWNLKTLHLERSWPVGGVGWFTEFSPNGTRLLSSSGSDQTASWSIPDGGLLGKVDGARASLAIMTPLLAGFSVNPFMDSRPAVVHISNYETGIPLRSLLQPARAVALSPDGQSIALGLVGSNVVVLDTAEDIPVATLTTPVEAFQLRFSADGTRLAMAGGDSAVRVWNLAGQPARSGADSFGETRQHEDSTLPATTPVRAATALAEGHWLKTWAVAFSPDGRKLASTSSDRSVRIWDAENLQPLERLNGHADEVWCVAWSPDGRRLVTGGKDGKVMVWQTGDVRPELRLPNDASRRPIVSRDGANVLTHPASAGLSGPALWSSAGERIDRWPSGYTFIGFTPQGDAAVELDAADGALHCWRPDADRPYRRVALKTWAIADLPSDYQAGLSPDGRLCFIAQTNGLVRIWDTSTGVLSMRFNTRPLPLVAATISSSGRWLALSPEQPYVAYLYDTHTGAETGLYGHTEYVKRLAFSQDDRLLATAGVDGRIRLWNTADGQEVVTLFGHWQSVDDVAFSPDGRTLASIESRTCLKLWRLDTFRQVASVSIPTAGEFLCFAPAGDRLYFAQLDGTVACFEAPFDPK